jgi:integrator complex subunit 3
MCLFWQVIHIIEQVFWLINELTKTNVQGVDALYLCLMRQIRGGDISQPNLLLCDQIIKLCDAQRSWLSLSPRVIATAVYTYLRVIADHRSSNLQALQQKEIRFVISLIREKVLTRLLSTLLLTVCQSGCYVYL